MAYAHGGSGRGRRGTVNVSHSRAEHVWVSGVQGKAHSGRFSAGGGGCIALRFGAIVLMGRTPARLLLHQFGAQLKEEEEEEEQLL